MIIKRHIFFSILSSLFLGLLFVYLTSSHVIMVETFDSLYYFSLYKHLLADTGSENFNNIKHFEIFYEIFLKIIGIFSLEYSTFVYLNISIIAIWKVSIFLTLHIQKKIKNYYLFIFIMTFAYPLYSQDIWIWRNVWANLLILSFILSNAKINKIVFMVLAMLTHYVSIPFFLFYFTFQLFRFLKFPRYIILMSVVISSAILSNFLLQYSRLVSQGNLISYSNSSYGGASYSYVVLWLIIIYVFIFEQKYLSAARFEKLVCFWYIVFVAFMTLPFYQFEMILYRASGLSFYLLFFILLSDMNTVKHKKFFMFSLSVLSLVTLERLYQ